MVIKYRRIFFLIKGYIKPLVTDFKLNNKLHVHADFYRLK